VPQRGSDFVVTAGVALNSLTTMSSASAPLPSAAVNENAPFSPPCGGTELSKPRWTAKGLLQPRKLFEDAPAQPRKAGDLLVELTKENDAIAAEFFGRYQKLGVLENGRVVPLDRSHQRQPIKNSECTSSSQACL